MLWSNKPYVSHHFQYISVLLNAVWPFDIPFVFHGKTYRHHPPQCDAETNNATSIHDFSRLEHFVLHLLVLTLELLSPLRVRLYQW